MMMQAIGHPTDVHGIISEYRVEAVTLSFSGKNFERDLIKYGKIIEGFPQPLSSVEYFDKLSPLT